MISASILIKIKTCVEIRIDASKCHSTSTPKIKNHVMAMSLQRLYYNKGGLRWH